MDACECDNELLGFMKYRETLDWLRARELLRKDSDPLCYLFIYLFIYLFSNLGIVLDYYESRVNSTYSSYRIEIKCTL